MHSASISVSQRFFAVLLLVASCSAAYVPYANGLTAEVSPASVTAVSSSTHVFQHKVVYVNTRRCDLVCRSNVCRYCPLAASSVRYKPVYASCFSPERSMAMDKDYSKGHFTSVMHSVVSSANVAGFAPSPTKLVNGITDASSYVFKNKMVVVNSQRCELVCRSHGCQYCPHTANDWNVKTDYGACYSPRRSIAIDKEYASKNSVTSYAATPSHFSDVSPLDVRASPPVAGSAAVSPLTH